MCLQKAFLLVLVQHLETNSLTPSIISLDLANACPYTSTVCLYPLFESLPLLIQMDE